MEPLLALLASNVLQIWVHRFPTKAYFIPFFYWRNELLELAVSLSSEVKRRLILILFSPAFVFFESHDIAVAIHTLSFNFLDATKPNSENPVIKI